MTERLYVSDYVQKNQAISSDEAERIYSILFESLNEKRRVVLDFSGITLLISSFLNSAVGKLYGAFNNDLIDKSVKYENMDSQDVYILNMVIGRAKDYYKNKDIIDGIVNEA